MKIFEEMIAYFRTGMRSAPTHKEWDEILNKLIDTDKITHAGEYTITFSCGVEVWCGKRVWDILRFYNYGAPFTYEGATTPKILPSRRTALKLRKLMEKQPFAERDVLAGIREKIQKLESLKENKS